MEHFVLYPALHAALLLQSLFISITCQNFAKIVTEIYPLQNNFFLLDYLSNELK